MKENKSLLTFPLLALAHDIQNYNLVISRLPTNESPWALAKEGELIRLSLCVSYSQKSSMKKILETWSLA